MTDAIYRFFPESVGETTESLYRPPTASSVERPTMHRAPSRMSVASIVGEDNGERPGGFILVADGAALLQVCGPCYFITDMITDHLSVGL